MLGRDDVGASYADLPEVRRRWPGAAATVLRRRGDYQRPLLAGVHEPRRRHPRPPCPPGDRRRPCGRRGDAVALPRGLFLGIYQDRGRSLLGIGLIFFTLLVLAGLLSRGIARPIEALGRGDRECRARRRAVPEPPATAAIEIRALYDNFASMAERIERRSRYLRDFAAAVSHEFKTPIAGISGAIELAIRTYSKQRT